MPEETKKKASLRMNVAKKMLELMSSAFALVAALAWNDAIQSAFRKIFGDQDGLVAKFVYAGVVTVIIVIIGIRLSRITAVLEGEE